MSDEQALPSMTPAMSPVEGDDDARQMTAEQNAANKQAKLQKTLRIGETEDVLLTRRCSIFAFMPMYFLGLLILGIHMFFAHAEAKDNAEWYEEVFFWLVGASVAMGGFGFGLIMLFLAWLNRVINHSASGRWVTTYLLIVAVTPLVINVDGFLGWFTGLLADIGIMDKAFGDFIGVDYNLTIAGIFYSSLFIVLTFLYQKSFLYAVTSERIIHYQWFLYERDAHRVLHEDVLKVHTRRTPVGALFGYNTIYCDIGDGSHLSTESIGGGVAIPSSADTSTGADGEKKGWRLFRWIRKLVFFATFQRTIKRERFTPEQSFYGIRHWEEAFDLINKLQHENSTATKQDQQLEVLMEMKDMLSNNPDAAADVDVDDLLSDI